MTKTIIIPYRNRLEHLKILIPTLRQYFPQDEIIVVEQNNNEKFRKACLLNVGVKNALGDLVILHDVDYIPTENVVYYENDVDVYLPVQFATFVYNDLTPKPLDEIPGGYRHFKDGVDDDFFGGVLTFKKESFFKINGSCPLYIGWGFEDADLRNRAITGGLIIERNRNNTFLVLDHPDSCPSSHDEDFRNNIYINSQFKNYWKYGIRTQQATLQDIKPVVSGIDRWILASEFDGPTYIVTSSF